MTTKRIEHKGRKFLVQVVPDEHMGAPWKEHDGHGEVTDWVRRGPQSGERELCRDRGAARYYNVETSFVMARKDWGITDETEAYAAVERDYQRMRAWCEGMWSWVGVVVAPFCECCGSPDEAKAQSLWGIESDAGAYLDEVALELAAECPA